MTDAADELRDGAGALPAELRVPLADLLDALERWDWVGADTVMDDWVGATRRLRDAHKAVLTALEPTASEVPPAANLAVPDLPPWERELLLKNAVVDAAVVWAQLPIGSPVVSKATAALVDAVEALTEVSG